MRQRPATTPHPAPEQPPPVAPATVEISPHRLHMADAYTATFAVCGYPATVTDAWLEPLLSWPGRLDLAVHIEPIPPEAAARLLRIQRTRLEAGRRYHADQGRLDDPSLDVAAGDAADLAHGVARAATRLFATGIYLTVHAASRDELSEACAQIRAAAAGLLLDVQPATWRHLPGWRTTLPLGVDELGQTRVLDTDALAAALPHASPDPPAPPPGAGVTATAVLYGLNLATGSPVWWDRWACDNHNSILVARSGAGKSYLTKLDLLRNLYHGVHAAVVDPEDEYTHLAEAAGGTVVRLGAPGVHLNPLDLPAPDTRPDALQRRALFVQTFIETLTGAGMDPYQQAALVQAITAAYADAGISDDPATWQRPAPLLADVAARLSETATALAARLAPYVSGPARQPFEDRATVRGDSHLVVWSLRQVPDELRPAATMLALDRIWQAVDRPASDHSRNLVVVDEAWQLLRQPSAANWLYTMAKSARKRRTGLAVVTQDLTDVLSTDLGRTVIANSATQLLMRQAPQNLDPVTDAFALSSAERDLLGSLRRGEALLVAGEHVAFEVLAAPHEHTMICPAPL